MYEELIKRLRYENLSVLQMIDLMDEAANAIEELEKAVHRWIPVTERLPEEDVPVFVYLFGDSPYIAWINHENEWETEEFTIDRDYLPQAWMPLPEPPKEEE